MPLGKTAHRDDDMMDPEEVAQFLKVTPRWVRREGPGHGLTLYSVGKFKRLRRREVLSWLEQQRDY